MSNAGLIHEAPATHEVLELTRQELTTVQNNDPISECGRAALAILTTDPSLCLKLAYQKLHDVPYREVKTCWRRLYTDASLWQLVSLVEGCFELENGTAIRNGKPGVRATLGDKIMDEVVRMLDMSLILTGTPHRGELVELWFAAIKEMLSKRSSVDDCQDDYPDRPSKRRKLVVDDTCARPRSRFDDQIREMPKLRNPLPRATNLHPTTFGKKLKDAESHTPVIIEDAIGFWPAMKKRPWSDPQYLLEQTLGGRRLVPIEIGKSYTDSGWGQRIITFRDFMDNYMLHSHDGGNITEQCNTDKDPSKMNKSQQTGYLAQHDLFNQIPSLRSDISIPDYCYCEPTPSPHLTHIKAVPTLDDVLLNAWFGPAGTVSPLHTDPYHNILAQVVGYKYIRLYAPTQTDKLYPRDVDENGIDMSNTSQVDLDEAMAVYSEISCWDAKVGEVDEERKREFEEQFGQFKEAEYVECVLGPGECLYIPVGWWHYVRSLTPSFSVSFWFN